MTNWLLRCFVRDAEHTDRPAVRFAYGRLAGVAGIIANILLFVTKLTAGILAGSLAVTADAFNNLSDAGSSVVTLVGFKLSSAPPDKQHPFGHGRVEYLSALGVAALIMVAGFELLVSSVDKIVHPTPAVLNWFTPLILTVSIAVKGWMAVFFRALGNRIHSNSLYAASVDSRNDVICTAVILVTTLLDRYIPFDVDGYVGAGMAIFVLWSGFSVIKDTVSPLLGQAPDEELVADIKRTVTAYDGVVGVHDLMVHNYGPARTVLSLHAEVDCHADLLRSHELIDCIERDLQHKYNALVCIHMDPVDFDNPQVAELRAMCTLFAAEIDEDITLHDFRVVFGEEHTNLIFDLVLPFTCKHPDAVAEQLAARIHTEHPQLYAVITAEYAFA